MTKRLNLHLRRNESEKERGDWTALAIEELFAQPFFALVAQAHSIHRQSFPQQQIQVSSLLSIKTGNCPEDCAYCAQSARHHTGIKAHQLVDLATVKAAAEQARHNGITRLCLGAAWRSPPQKQFPQVLQMIRCVKEYGLEACVTLGLLNAEEVQQLKAAGLDYYNHNLDTSPKYYSQIVTTHTFAERLTTLALLNQAKIKICCGGILGMGETHSDRVQLLQQLANLTPQPQSVPFNWLVPIAGTPLAEKTIVPLDPFEFVKVIAVARILMPLATIRLAAGRACMNDELQAWCFFAGANSIFGGEKLLTTANSGLSRDQQLLQRLGLQIGKTHCNCP